MPQELSIIEKTYQLIRWLHGHVIKFPRHSKYGLGNRLENCALDLLEKLIEAKFSKSKTEALRNASLALEKLLILLRIAKDFHLFSFKSHRFAVDETVQISRQLQGWRRYVDPRET